MSTQTTQGEEGVAHVLVQAGDGKLLSEAELREKYTQRELRVSEGEGGCYSKVRVVGPLRSCCTLEGRRGAMGAIALLMSC